MPDGIDYLLKSIVREITLAKLAIADRNRDHLDKALDNVQKLRKLINARKLT